MPKFVVRRSAIHGKGLFAARSFCVGDLVVEYRGERIAWADATSRHAESNGEPSHTFLFDLGDGLVIDGGRNGNSARWINHSCMRNCEAELDSGRVFIVAARTIEPGDELMLDYALVLDERHTARRKTEYACRCGAPACRGTMLGSKRRGR